ncbi:DUF5615 family PIN-like protein [Natronorarus salvus]|uniref:DUF5615 family PIN-like protein n=1 Tax=Natronorarus salvus TaxID=3117733 RepID=UPI002F25EEC2
MRLLCDENVKRSVFELLRQEGYDVERVQGRLELGFEAERSSRTAGKRIASC